MTLNVCRASHVESPSSSSDADATNLPFANIHLINSKFFLPSNRSSTKYVKAGKDDLFELTAPEMLIYSHSPVRFSVIASPPVVVKIK